jgi:exodeoxyribonuclease V beta subunit
LGARVATGPNPAVDLKGWLPTVASVKPSWTEGEFERLRRVHAAAMVTSYTQLTRHQFTPSGVGDDEVSEDTELPITALPGGREVGIFLHEVLERLDYSEALAAVHADELFEAATSSRLFIHFAHRHGVPSEQWPEAHRILFAGLRTPIERPELHLPQGLAQLTSLVRESEFLFPMESSAGALGSHPRSEATYIQGVVDLLFQHGDRYFVVDWKSDRRSDWSRQALDTHVAEHYALQARLYAVAAGRLLEIQSEEDYEARFGGLMYCFLRAMDPTVPNHGIHFERPTWTTFREWSDLSDLRDQSEERAS